MWACGLRSNPLVVVASIGVKLQKRNTIYVAFYALLSTYFLFLDPPKISMMLCIGAINLIYSYW
jgi:hypothetical protein